MSEEVDAVLEEIRGEATVGLYLVWGEEYLVRKATDLLVQALLPADLMGLNYSVLDGAGPREVAQDLAT